MRPIDEDGELLPVLGLEADRFLHARNGDNLLTPFQCDWCHFANLLGRHPSLASSSDLRLLKCIRRSNLDAFWALEPLTVRRNLDEIKRGLTLASSFGFAHQLFRPLGPFPLDDSFGMGAAVIMQLRSLDQGKYSSFLQFETVRKFRSAVSNVYHASLEGQGAMVMAKDTRKLVVTECPTYGSWFEKTMKGMHKRMGDDVRPDRALALDILKEIMKLLESDWQHSTTEARLPLALEASFYLIAYTLALRGEEVPLVEIKGTRRHWAQSSAHATPHIIIALLGRFKNEIGESYHLMPVVPSTPRGLEPKKWIERALEEWERRGVIRGYFFQNAQGERLPPSHFEPQFFDRLERVKSLRPDLIPPHTDIMQEYGVSRSFRRGATSEVTNLGLPNEVIEANGRWRKSQISGPRRAHVTIREHYTDVRLTLNLLLRFSQAL